MTTDTENVDGAMEASQNRGAQGVNAEQLVLGQGVGGPAGLSKMIESFQRYPYAMQDSLGKTKLSPREVRGQVRQRAKRDAYFEGDVDLASIQYHLNALVISENGWGVERLIEFTKAANQGNFHRQQSGFRNAYSSQGGGGGGGGPTAPGDRDG